MSNKYYNLARIGYHKPDETTLPKYHAINEACIQLAIVFDTIIPDSPDKTVALRTVEHARMLANAAVAIGDQPMFVDLEDDDE